MTSDGASVNRTTLREFQKSLFFFLYYYYCPRGLSPIIDFTIFMYATLSPRASSFQTA